MAYWLPLPLEVALKIIQGSARPYTRELAYIAVSVDIHQSQLATISGWAAQWGWSRGKVRRFLTEIGVQLVYPINTNERQNQRGQIVIQMSDRSRTDHKQLKMLYFSGLNSETDRKKTENGQIEDRSCATPRVIGLKDIPIQIKTTTASDLADLIDEYLFLGTLYGGDKGSAPCDPAGWLNTVKGRLQQQGGLSEIDRSQLSRWRHRNKKEQEHTAAVIRQKQDQDKFVSIDPDTHRQGLINIRKIRQSLD